MNDYYPFLVEKISKLERNSEVRSTAYNSAREELIRKLTSPTLRVQEAEIARERRAFEAAIETIEAELARGDTSDVWPLESMRSRTFSDSPVSAPLSPIELESTPTTLIGEDNPETRARATPGSVALTLDVQQPTEKLQPERELPHADRVSRAGDIRALPRDAHEITLKSEDRTPSGVVAQTLRKQLLSMMFVMVVFCLVFAALYFSTSIDEWLGN
jgi:hypothetical protein